MGRRWGGPISRDCSSCLLIAFAAEWRLWENATTGWSAVSGISWGLALWVSLYEPLVLLAVVLLVGMIKAPAKIISEPRRIGWRVMAGIVLLAVLIERRWPGPPGFGPFFARWAQTIGELHSISLTNPIWLSWVGGLILLSPFLIALAFRRRGVPRLFLALLILLFLLSLWEARWGYFFAFLFVLTIPAQFAVVRQRWLTFGLLLGSLFPMLQF